MRYELQKRAATLNEISRRGVLRSMGLYASVGLFRVKNSTLRLIWQATGALPPVGVPEAAAFLRQFNTIQTAWYIERGKHATKDEAFGEIIKHREHFKPGTLGYAWMSRLNLFSDEVLPGWTMDFVNTNAGQIGKETLATGYRLILRGERYTLITDEGVGLYQARTKPDQPKAKDLKSAKAFPGAVGHYVFRDDMVSLRRSHP